MKKYVFLSKKIDGDTDLLVVRFPSVDEAYCFLGENEGWKVHEHVLERGNRGQYKLSSGFEPKLINT